MILTCLGDSVDQAAEFGVWIVGFSGGVVGLDKREVAYVDR